MDFKQSVSPSFTDGQAVLEYSIQEVNGLLGFDGKIFLTPLALLDMIAKATSNTIDDKIVAALESLLADKKAQLAAVPAAPAAQ